MSISLQVGRADVQLASAPYLVKYRCVYQYRCVCQFRCACQYRCVYIATGGSCGRSAGERSVPGEVREPGRLRGAELRYLDHRPAGRQPLHRRLSAVHRTALAHHATHAPAGAPHAQSRDRPHGLCPVQTPLPLRELTALPRPSHWI